MSYKFCSLIMLFLNHVEKHRKWPSFPSNFNCVLSIKRFRNYPDFYVKTIKFTYIHLHKV